MRLEKVIDRYIKYLEDKNVDSDKEILQLIQHDLATLNEKMEFLNYYKDNKTKLKNVK